MPNLIPFLVLGLALGGVFALSGVGTVILYRATGVLYLAGGAVGALTAFLAWTGIRQFGLPVPVAVVLAIVLGSLVTWAYGVLIGPMLAQRTPLVKAVASLGLMLVLLSVMTLVWTAETYSLDLPTSSWGLRAGLAYMNGTQMIAVALGIVVTVASSLFLKYTRIGIGMRALANDRETSAMLGIPVRHVESIAWLASGVLFASSGVLLGNLVGLDIPGLTFLIIAGLSAALVGGLRSIPVTLVAALGIGVLQSAITPFPAISSFRSMTPFLVAIIVVLIVAWRSPAQKRV